MEDIYWRNVDSVYRICYMYMKNKSDTEDMVQETFAKLMQSKIEFINREHEKGWLILTASNLCKNSLKHWFRTKTNDIDDYLDSYQTCDEDRELLETVINLPSKYKAAIYLHYYEGYKCSEIALMLKTSESNVKSLLHRGRKILEKTIGGEMVG